MDNEQRRKELREKIELSILQAKERNDKKYGKDYVFKSILENADILDLDLGDWYNCEEDK